MITAPSHTCQECLRTIVNGRGHSEAEPRCSSWRPVRRWKCRMTGPHNGHGLCPGIDFPQVPHHAEVPHSQRTA